MEGLLRRFRWRRLPCSIIAEVERLLGYRKTGGKRVPHVEIEATERLPGE
jgi:hypothetical protein